MGGLHFLSEQDHVDALSAGMPLPDPSWTVATDEQAQAISNPPPTPAQLWAAYQAKAQAMLDASDTTMHRIAEGVIDGGTSWMATDVVPWATYRKTLRAVIGTKAPGDPTQPLPVRPPYPAGT